MYNTCSLTIHKILFCIVLTGIFLKITFPFRTVKILRPTVNKICTECFNGLPEKKEANKK